MTNQYDLKQIPAGVWSAPFPVPRIGEKVNVTCNGLGPGTVESYFIEGGYTGVAVRLASPPAWHVEQTKGTKWEGIALVFGAEIS